MNTQLLTKVAAVLEALADDFDARTKQAAETLAAQRHGIISPIVEKVAFSTGDDQDSVRAKLANADTDILGIISKLASDEAPAELGGPQRNKTASAEPAKNKADQRFLDWLSS